MSSHQLSYGGGEVYHECGGAGVGLGEGYAETEGFDFHAAANGESRQEVALVGAHVGARLVVIAGSDVDVARWQILDAENEVAEEVAGKLVLLDEVARSVVLVGRLVVGEFPLCEVIGSD